MAVLFNHSSIYILVCLFVYSLTKFLCIVRSFVIGVLYLFIISLSKIYYLTE